MLSPVEVAVSVVAAVKLARKSTKGQPTDSTAVALQTRLFEVVGADGHGLEIIGQSIEHQEEIASLQDPRIREVAKREAERGTAAEALRLGRAAAVRGAAHAEPKNDSRSYAARGGVGVSVVSREEQERQKAVRRIQRREARHQKSAMRAAARGEDGEDIILNPNMGAGMLSQEEAALERGLGLSEAAARALAGEDSAGWEGEGPLRLDAYGVAAGSSGSGGQGFALGVRDKGIELPPGTVERKMKDRRELVVPA